MDGLLPNLPILLPILRLPQGEAKKLQRKGWCSHQITVFLINYSRLIKVPVFRFETAQQVSI